MRPECPQISLSRPQSVTSRVTSLPWSQMSGLVPQTPPPLSDVSSGGWHHSYVTNCLLCLRVPALLTAAQNSFGFMSVLNIYTEEVFCAKNSKYFQWHAPESRQFQFLTNFLIRKQENLISSLPGPWLRQTELYQNIAPGGAQCSYSNKWQNFNSPAPCQATRSKTDNLNRTGSRAISCIQSIQTFRLLLNLK